MTTNLDDNRATKQAAVTVYTKPNCQQCRATFRWLDKRGFTYTTVDISQDLEALQFIQGLGHMAAPVVYVSSPDGDDHWSGFNPDKLRELL
jgi:glutaredoxin-like protein NrdH